MLTLDILRKAGSLMAFCAALSLVGCSREEAPQPSASVRPEPTSQQAARPTPPAAQPAPQAGVTSQPKKTPLPNVPGKTERLNFKRGTSGAEIKGGVIRGERNRYLLGALKGQTMTVSLSSEEDNAAFSILAPDGTTIPGTEEERDLKQWKGTLPQSGDTVISVGPTRGNASFTLKVEITGSPQK